LLPAKLDAIHFLPTKSLPKDMFALGRLFTELARSFNHFALGLWRHYYSWKIIFHINSFPSPLVGEGLGMGLA
jgi:hypothetical protein